MCFIVVILSTLLCQRFMEQVFSFVVGIDIFHYDAGGRVGRQPCTGTGTAEFLLIPGERMRSMIMVCNLSGAPGKTDSIPTNQFGLYGMDWIDFNRR